MSSEVMTEEELARLVEQDRALDFSRFTHTDAWAVGSSLVATGTEHAYPIAIAIWLGEQRVFHAGLPGSSANNDSWMERKAALVRHFTVSSWLTTNRLRRRGVEEPTLRLGLDPSRYTLSGGGVPIRVQGTLVGVATVSGLTDAEDHALVVAALRAHRERGSKA